MFVTYESKNKIAHVKSEHLPCPSYAPPTSSLTQRFRWLCLVRPLSTNGSLINRSQCDKRLQLPIIESRSCSHPVQDLHTASLALIQYRIPSSHPIQDLKLSSSTGSAYRISSHHPVQDLQFSSSTRSAYRICSSHPVEDLQLSSSIGSKCRIFNCHPVQDHPVQDLQFSSSIWSPAPI